MTRLTYRDLNARANRLARVLVARNGHGHIRLAIDVRRIAKRILPSQLIHAAGQRLQPPIDDRVLGGIPLLQRILELAEPLLDLGDLAVAAVLLDVEDLDELLAEAFLHLRIGSNLAGGQGADF